MGKQWILYTPNGNRFEGPTMADVLQQASALDHAEPVDYFECLDAVPDLVRAIVDGFNDVLEPDYDDCRNLQAALQELGWTCDYGLDGVPLDLQPLAKPLTEKAGGLTPDSTALPKGYTLAESDDGFTWIDPGFTTESELYSTKAGAFAAAWYHKTRPKTEKAGGQHE